jgi:hypothetical protein
MSSYTQIGPLCQLTTNSWRLGFRFLRIATCDHVFDDWETIPSEISNVFLF